jgi:hypothetical protein
VTGQQVAGSRDWATYGIMGIRIGMGNLLAHPFTAFSFVCASINGRSFYELQTHQHDTPYRDGPKRNIKYNAIP